MSSMHSNEEYYASHVSVLIDANVLACARRRRILLRFASSGIIRPFWSLKILEETKKAIMNKPRGRKNGDREVNTIIEYFPESIVEDYEHHVPRIKLPDADDRHVVAAALQAPASIIVTENLKHFKSEYLNAHDLKAICADEFIAITISFNVDVALGSIKKMLDNWTNPPYTPDQFISELKSNRYNLTRTAEILNEYKFLL